MEDNQDGREMLAELLEHHGYEVSQAAHGQQALDLLRAGTSPNLILLDLNMPVLDGREFLRIARADPALARFRIIMLTANEDGVDAGDVDAVLRKPADLETLLALVAKSCGES